MHESEALDKLNVELKGVNMIGQWMFDALLEKAIGGPAPAGIPFHWPWTTVSDMLEKSVTALPDSKTARRTLGFSNPGLPTGSTHTILGSVQLVLPGELAWSHSHAISALRFSIEGARDLFTVVDGEPLPMERHDLVLTPAWAWHDHHNESQSRGIWLDVLDLPMVAALKQTAYRVLGEKAQNITGDRRDDIDARPGFMRLADTTGAAHPPALRFPWTDVERSLAQHSGAKGDPDDGILLEYINPVTGQSVLPTLGCNIRMLNGGFAGRKHRLTSSSICYVVEGEGATDFEGQTIEWNERDIFVIPNWMWHSHRNRSKKDRALLFVVNDLPMLKAMGIDRRECAP